MKYEIFEKEGNPVEWRKNQLKLDQGNWFQMTNKQTNVEATKQKGGKKSVDHMNLLYVFDHHIQNNLDNNDYDDGWNMQTLFDDDHS